MKKILFILLSIILIIATACGENYNFIFDCPTQVNVGDTYELAITGAEANELKFSSSDNNIITVDENGVIKAIGKGNATIKGVYKKDETITYEITIEVIEKEEIKINAPSQTIGVGETIDFSVEVKPESAKETLSVNVIPEGIIEIVDGKIKGLSEGVAVIEATTSNAKEEITINVVALEPTLEISKTSVTIIESKEVEISYQSTNGEVIVSSNNNDIATVKLENDKIIINAKNVGETVVKVSIINDKKSIEKEIEVTVKENKIPDFTIDTIYAKKDISSEIELTYDHNYDVSFTYDYDKTKLEITNNTIKGIVLGETELTVTEEISGITRSTKITVYEYTVEAISQYLLDIYDELEVNKNLELIDEYYNSGIKIEYSMTDTTYLSNNGVFKQPVIDKSMIMLIIYEFDGEEVIEFATLILKGWGTPFDVATQYIDERVPELTKKRLDLPDDCYEVDAKYTWYADGNELEGGYYDFERTDGDDYYIDLKCVIEINNETQEKSYRVRCVMLDSEEKLERVFLELKGLYEDEDIYGDIELPTESDKYIVEITWRSYNPYVITDEGKVTKPFKDIVVEFMLTVEMGEYERREIVSTVVKGENKSEMWEKVDVFLNAIHKELIETHRFYLYGYESGYETVLSLNNGYLPFYQMDELKVTEDILPDGSALKANRNRTSTNYITLHNSGMAHPSATAQGLNEYIHTTDRIASWHFSVDDKEAYQELKLDEVGWHAGDGGYVYGDIYYNETYKRWSIGGGNNNSVGIEMCVYAGVDFNMVMRNTAKLTAKLLVHYGLTPSDVRQHYDFAGKDCPQVLRQAGRWSEMLELISLEYYALTELQGVTFKFTSLTPEYLDDTGKIINNPDTEPIVKYQVEVTYNGETKTFVYSSILSKKK